MWDEVSSLQVTVVLEQSRNRTLLSRKLIKEIAPLFGDQSFGEQLEIARREGDLQAQGGVQWGR